MLNLAGHAGRQEVDMTDTQAAREKLIDDFSAVIADSEVLLRAMAAAGGEKAQALRADLDRKLREARARLVEIQGAAADRSREVARQADEYVRAHPWESIAIGAGIAAVVGIMVGLLISRR
jgi:ElaB/YqjD/DUF883 family membrane-anchored ribosome-binding protein